MAEDNTPESPETPEVPAKRGFFVRLRERFGILAEFWDFLRVRKKWWLGPIVVILLLLSILIVMTQGSAIAPFIYTIF